MSQFSGPQPGYKDSRTRTKGVMKQRKELKRLEAEARDDLLAPDDPRRRVIRLGLENLDLEKPRRRRRSRRNQSGEPVSPVIIGEDVFPDATSLPEESLKVPG